MNKIYFYCRFKLEWDFKIQDHMLGSVPKVNKRGSAAWYSLI